MSQDQSGGTNNPPEQRELTYGEKAVGLTFNPSGDENVTAIKEEYANIIDLLNGQFPKEGTNVKAEEVERIKLLKFAIRQAQTAQMWAVKAITWKY